MRIIHWLWLGLLSGCTVTPPLSDAPTVSPRKMIAVGYGTMNHYFDYPEPQQHLLAIRAAKLDAYRSLAEELYGTQIRGNTTIRDMAVRSDSYRAYVDAVVRGASLRAVAMKAEGIYEAEVELDLNSAVFGCLRIPGEACSANSRAGPSANRGDPAVYGAPMYSVRPYCGGGCGPADLGF